MAWTRTNDRVNKRLSLQMDTVGVSRIVVVALASGAVALQVTGCGDQSIHPAPKTVTVTSTVAVGATTIPGDAPMIPYPGRSFPAQKLFRVGVDIQPGTYVSQPMKAGSICIWVRSASLDPDGPAIDSGAVTELVRVTIEPTDVAFTSSLCQTWHKVD